MQVQAYTRSGILAAALCILAAPCLRAETVAVAKSAPVPALEIIVLGSGGPAALGRASSSYLVLLDGQPRILVDSGPGSFARLGEARVSLQALDVVLLTHLHVDHAAELPGVVKARAVSSGQPIQFRIFGPEGHRGQGQEASFPPTSRFVDLLFGTDGAFPYLKDFSAPITFTTTDIANSGAAGSAVRVILREDSLAISAIGGHHGDAPAVIYRIDFRGHSVVFSGDIDAHGLPDLETLARRADLLVFDAVVLDPPGSPEILYTLHSPPQAIGLLASHSQVRQLLLSHLSPAVEQNRSAVSGSIARHFHGPVTYAADGMRVRP
jgi:ribonuclease BN (tRNA processing enzyme)